MLMALLDRIEESQLKSFRIYCSWDFLMQLWRESKDAGFDCKRTEEGFKILGGATFQWNRRLPGRSFMLEKA